MESNSNISEIEEFFTISEKIQIVELGKLEPTEKYIKITSLA